MPRSRHDSIADTLTREILLRQYRRGERLPSERELALRFCANRGAVREAMKKLESLGLISIQPGGARIAPLNEANLDVIGHMLAIDEVPDAELVDQILQLMSSLVRLAVDDALTRADDQRLESLRQRVRESMEPGLDQETLMTARLMVLVELMDASGNLPCRLIARSLLGQLGPRLRPLEGHLAQDCAEHRALTCQLDDALAQRDKATAQNVLEALSVLNRRQIGEALAAWSAAADARASEATS